MSTAKRTATSTRPKKPSIESYLRGRVPREMTDDLPRTYSGPICAASWNRYVERELPYLLDLPEVTEIGDLTLVNTYAPPIKWRTAFLFGRTGWHLQYLPMLGGGHVFFTGDARKIVLQKQQYGRPRVWMGFTPFELVSQRYGISRARGRCLVGGLGLGWFAHRVAQRTVTKHVTVVEKNEALCAFIGPRLKKLHGDRITIVQGDIYDYLSEDRFDENAYDSVLMDIWWAHGDAKHDQTWIAFVQRYRSSLRLWSWGYDARG